MRNICYILLCCVLSGFIACQEEHADLEAQGKIRLSITDRVQTKAMPDALTPELTDQFQVKMIRTEDKRLVFGGTCVDFNTKPQLFKSGTYTLHVSYGDNFVLGMDAPYYVSEEKNVMVEAGKEQEIVLPCSVGNALASFEFVNADKLDKVLKDYYIEIVVKGESVKWYPGSTENPYFKAGNEVTFYLKGTWIENNLPYSRKFAGVMPVETGKRYHYKLKFDTSNMTGAILDIEVDPEVENITVNQTLPQAWLPKPKITADGFDENKQLVYTETADAKTAVIHYAAVRPVQDVEMTLNFTDPQLAILNKTYLFSAMTDEEKQALQQAAVILPTLDGVAESGEINLTAMTSSLLTLDGGLDANNEVRLRVKANDRWSDEANYMITTIKPEFNISVYPGNIWTKEFTANPLVADSVKTGNFSRFENITYEFSIDGTNWTTLAADLRKDGLTPGTTYYVRPKYRGQVPGEICRITTYSPVSLTNGGLSGATVVKGKDSGITSYGSLYAWNGWATLNEMTCENCAAAAYAYNSRSGTRPTTGYEGDGVMILTIGYGYGGTMWSPKKVSPGELFLGVYNTKGIEYASHPTGVKFYYKYIPYDNDKSDIYIQVLSGNTILGTGSLQESATVDSYQEYQMNIEYDDNYKYLKPDKLVLVFKSGFNSSYTDKNKNNVKFYGSELYIDEVSLVYDK